MVTQNKYTNQPIADWKAGLISRAEAVRRLGAIYRGGGGSSAQEVAEAQARGEQAQAEEQARLQAEEQARQEALRIQQEQQKKAEEQAKIQQMTAGEQQAIQRARAGQQLTQVDVFNLQKVTEREGYGSFGGGKVASEGDIIRFIGEYGQEPKVTFKDYPKQSTGTGATVTFKDYPKQPPIKSQTFEQPISFPTKSTSSTIPKYDTQIQFPLSTQAPTKSTAISEYEIPTPEIILNPTISKRYGGEFFTERGEKVLTPEYVYTDPMGKEITIGGATGYISTERMATLDEMKLMLAEERALSLETGTASFGKPSILKTSGIHDAYYKLKGDIKELESITGEGLGQVTSSALKKTGLPIPTTIKEAELNIKESTEYLLDLGVPKYLARGGEFASYYGTGLLKGIKQQPLKYGLIFGISAGIGFGSDLALAGISRFSITAGSLARVGTIGVGAYFAGAYALDVGGQLVMAEGSQAKADILADATWTTASAVGGYKAGQKVYGKLSVLGREYVPLETIVPKDVLTGKKTFVESSTYGYKGSVGKQKQLFDVKLFKEKGYGYHTTGTKFWSDTITVEAGTSAFEGLYVAPEASIYFTKIGGGYKTFPTLQELMTGSKPAIAKIYPKGFDISGFYKTGRGYKFFKEDFGVGYVTGVKPETEAVFTIGSKFIKFGKGKYTIFKGKNVLIDELQFIDAVSKSDKNVFGVKQLKTSYYLPEKEALIYPSSLISAKISSSYKPSYKISSISSIIETSSYIKPSYQEKSSLVYPSVLNKSSIIKPSYYSDVSLLKPIKSSISSSVIRKPKPTGSSIIDIPYYPERPIIPKAPFSFGRRTKARRIKRIPTYMVQIRRGGVFKPIGTGLTKRQALLLGGDITLKDLARTFKIKQAGTKEVFGIDEAGLIPNERAFRQYQIRGKKRIPLPAGMFIQRTPTLLQTVQEKAQIQKARRDINNLINM